MLGEYSKEEGKMLLELARESIRSKFLNKKIEYAKDGKFRQLRGVFVTLTEKGELRGCVGFPFPNHPVSEAVYMAAREAAFSDPRFKALRKDELDKINIEISILTTPQDVKDIKEIEIGKDGLICNYMGYQGLLLPQVASEHHMTRIEFLEALSTKAGLPKDNWQNRNFRLQKFRCQIFSENEKINI